MAIEDHLDAEETVHARYEGDWTWVCTDERLLRAPGAAPDAAPEAVALGELRSVGSVRSRDTRFLVAALSAVLLAAGVPPLMMGLANVAVGPATAVAGVFAVLAVAGFAQWLRTEAPHYRFQGPATTDDWRLPDDEEAAAFVDAVRERL